MSRSRGMRWKPGDQRSPKMLTIGIAIVLVLVGALLTVGLPMLADAMRLSRSLEDTLELIGVGSLAAAMILMLLGIFIEGL
jgi:hypothetical protein